MANLFGLPSPQQVRQSVTERLFSTGDVSGAGQAGKAIGFALAGGGQNLPEVQKAQKVQGIMQRVQSQFGETLDSPQDWIKLGTALSGEFMKEGMTDEAMKVMESIKSIQKTAKDRKIVKGADGYNYYADTGERVLPGVVKAEKDPLVNVTVGDSPFLKQLAKRTEERLGNAEIAAKSFETTREMRDLLDEGIITGFGSEFITSAGSALQQMGFDTGDAVGNTQAYAGAVGKLVANVIRDFGAGTGLSDADREFALSIAAGRTSMTEKALRRLIDINDRASEAQIRFHNKAVDKLPGSISADVKESYKVSMPPRGLGKPVATDQQGRKVYLKNGKYIYSDGTEYK